MLQVTSYMIIGIDASRAFQKKKTGIEEYSYQVIKHLRDFLKISLLASMTGTSDFVLQSGDKRELTGILNCPKIGG